HWLLVNGAPIADDRCGWPLEAVSGEGVAGARWLSAGVQGLAISVLLRAYELTGQGDYLACAERAARTFAWDILDGGVTTPLGDAGLVFEDVALYPATHRLSGFLLALVSLHESLALQPAHALTAPVMDALERGHATLHQLVDPQADAYDTGYWTRVDL